MTIDLKARLQTFEWTTKDVYFLSAFLGVQAGLDQMLREFVSDEDVGPLGKHKVPTVRILARLALYLDGEENPNDKDRILNSLLVIAKVQSLSYLIKFFYFGV